MVICFRVLAFGVAFWSLAVWQVAHAQTQGDVPASEATFEQAERSAAIAQYFAWALSEPGSIAGFEQRDGYWRFTHNRLADFFPGAIGEDVSIRPTETICDAAVGASQSCTIQAHVRPAYENQTDDRFMVRPLRLTIVSEPGAGLRVTEVCEVFVERCSAVPEPDPEMAAEIRAALLPAPSEPDVLALPSAEHLEAAAFEVTTLRLDGGASIPVLAVLSTEIGFGFGDQGLVPPLAIRQAFRFGGTTIVKPIEILRLLAESKPGEQIGLWVIDLEDSGGTRIDLVHQTRNEFENARAIAGQRIALETGTVFDTSTFTGLRLELMRRGYFESLETLIDVDAETAVAELGPYAALFELFLPDLTDIVAEGRYGGFSLLYGLLRMDILGDCGESVSRYRQTEEITWELRNGFGVRRGQPWQTTNEWAFDLPSRFADIAEREQNLVFPPSRYGSELRTAIEGLTCDDNVRRALEANLVAFYFRRPPAVVYPYEPRSAWPPVR